MSGALDQVRAQFNAAVHELPAEQMIAAKQRIDELITEFDEATTPTTDPDVTGALTQLRQVSARLAEATRRVHRIVGALQALTGQWGLAPIRRTLPPVPAVPARRTASTPVSRDTAGDLPVIEEHAKKLPIRIGPTDKTEGFLLSTVRSGTMRSSRPSLTGGFAAAACTMARRPSQARDYGCLPRRHTSWTTSKPMPPQHFGAPTRPRPLRLSSTAPRATVRT